MLESGVYIIRSQYVDGFALVCFSIACRVTIIKHTGTDVSVIPKWVVFRGVNQDLPTLTLNIRLLQHQIRKRPPIFIDHWFLVDHDGSDEIGTEHTGVHISKVPTTNEIGTFWERQAVMPMDRIVEFARLEAG